MVVYCQRIRLKNSLPLELRNCAMNIRIQYIIFEYKKLEEDHRKPEEVGICGRTPVDLLYPIFDNRSLVLGEQHYLQSTYRKLGLDHGPSLREEKHHEKGAGEKRLPTWGKQGRWPCLPQKQGAQEPPDNTQRAQYALENF